MKRNRLAVVSTLVLGLAACGGGQQSEPQQSAPPATAAAAKPDASAEASAEFGVPECDAYVSKYLACIDSKVPESARDMVRQQLDQTKAQWKQAASTPQGKQGLAMGCKAATDAARTAMQAYGCTF